MHDETGKLTTSLLQFRRFILLRFLLSWFLEFSASFDGLLVVFSCETIDSSKSQIDPFSPIRNATDLGSIHSVSSSGSVRSLLRRPLAWAASAITGSREWLILMQRNPLPNKGFCGCQWCLYLAHKISFIFLWKASSCFSDSFPLPLIIFVTNLQAISTSAFMILRLYLDIRNWKFILQQAEFIASFCSFGIVPNSSVSFNNVTSSAVPTQRLTTKLPSTATTQRLLLRTRFSANLLPAFFRIETLRK